MDIIKVLFATFLTIDFFYELLEEEKNAKAILVIITYFIFLIICVHREFF